MTEQFIDAFIINNDWEILFVSTHERNGLGTEIYKKLKKSGIKTVELKSNSELEKITELYEIIEYFSPETVIAHTAPWDISGIVVMNMIAKYISSNWSVDDTICVCVRYFAYDT